MVYKTSYTGRCLTVERICARFLMCQPQDSCTSERPVSTSCWIPSGSRKARSPLPQLEAACARVALLGGGGRQSQRLLERPVEKETWRLWHFAAGAAAWRTA